ncbi:hypothetical protein IFM89_012523 [Coptis chinensis]|uniref:CRAL-TRIO domain-containing protein n=1 Tax=Coptis chinensis TaxID=261450 RepID=A0A835HLY0_9MAGN|nr:hypothetical protein IFM89_012523 [Coptis chinensis]
MPSFFVSAWKMISHFLEKATQEKFFPQKSTLIFLYVIAHSSSLSLSQWSTQKEAAQLTEMRKSLEQLGSTTENYGDAMLMRFLVARSMDPTKAAKMLVSWKKWREEFVPLGFIPDSQVPDELKAKKFICKCLLKTVSLFLLFKLTSISPQKTNPNSRNSCSFKEGKEIGNEKLIGILDLANIGYRNIDARALITGFQFLQAYYPERLAKFYILSMPWFFVSVWKMISLFLEKATLEKVVIVSSQDERKTFIKEIGEETLPEEYGGRAKLIALQDVTLSSISIVD